MRQKSYIRSELKEQLLRAKITLKHFLIKFSSTLLFASFLAIFLLFANTLQAATETSAPEINITDRLIYTASQSENIFTTTEALPKYTMGVAWHWQLAGNENSDLIIEYRLAQAGEWTQWINAEDISLPSEKEHVRHSELFIYQNADQIEYRIDFSKIDPADLIAVKYVPVIVPTKTDLDYSKLSASSAPDIISRAEWMAGHSPAQPYDSPEWPPGYPDTHLVQTIAIHHQGDGTTRPSDPAAAVYSVWYYHTFVIPYAGGNGWGDTGYHYMVDQYGNLYQGRFGENSVIGGHARSATTTYNVDLTNETSSVGVMVLGNYDVAGTYLTAASKDTLAEVSAWIGALNGFHPEGSGYFVDAVYPRIIGHRDFITDSTACPGANIYSQIPAIRTLAGSKAYDFLERVHPNGTIMRVGGTKTVYVIKDGLRRAFTHWETYKSHHLPYILAVSNDDIDNYEAGPKMGFRDGVLVRASDNPTVYLIADDQRHPFQSGTIFKALGYSFADVIVTDQSAVNLNPYGTKIDRSDIHPNGAVIKGSGPTVYLIDDGLRRAFTSSRVFNTWFSFSDVITVADSELDLYTKGDQMTFNDGVLLQNAQAEIPEGEENPVYIVSDQTYRPFEDHMTFNLYSYLWGYVIEVGDKEMGLTTIGDPVTLELPTL